MGEGWLEYSVATDVVYCFSCYLFKSEVADHGSKGGGDTFVGTGFRNWKEKEKVRKCEISVPKNMKDYFGVPKCELARVLNKQQFKVQLMYTALDYILAEFNNRFDEVNMRLLEHMSCLNPKNSYAPFDREKIIEFTTFYPSDFFELDLWILRDKLDSYYVDVTFHIGFSNLNGLSDLAQKLVATGKHMFYKKNYLLLKLAMILSVATTSVERVFSAMNYVKCALRNKMSDEWLNDCLLISVEFKKFVEVSNDDIIWRFQATGN